MATFVKHSPCEKCGSSDGLAEYDDGSSHCFVCKETAGGEGAPALSSSSGDWEPITGHYEALSKRRISEETLKKWQYQIGEYQGKPAQIKNYKDEHGKLLGQKYRLPGKEFRWQGDKGASDLLYGMWLWPSKGKSITITEGELDALSLSEAWDNQWPVVSLPNGSGSVKKAFKRCYDYLNGFASIVLMFDMDEPGREAVEAALELLPAGKVKIATLPEKDANEVLVKHGPGVLVKCFWDAKLYRPDGIISGADLDLEDLMSEEARGFDVPWMPELNEKLLGIRKGELTLLTAGSGIGKSTLLRQVCYHLKISHDCKIGNLYLEEKNKKTAQAYIALHHNLPLGRLRHNTGILTPDQWVEGKRAVVDTMCFYNHFGSLDSSRLISKLHYMATVEKVDFIALDHISIVTSGIESSSEGERKDIDILMTRLRSLIEETGVGVLGVVHLKRVTGKNFNEGASVALSDLRGSGSLEQLSDNVISLERDQQGEKKDVMLARVLKCRETGDTGEADTMQYDRATGRIEQFVDTGGSFDATEEVKEGEDVPF